MPAAMGKLLCDSSAAVETLKPSAPLLQWTDPAPVQAPPSALASELVDSAAGGVPSSWISVSGLENQQRRLLDKIHARGVFWRSPHQNEGAAGAPGVAFRLEHGGDVEADGNCLFTAARRAMMGNGKAAVVGARELRQWTVRRFSEDYESEEGACRREALDAAIRHLYSPDLNAGWGIHVVQEIKLLAMKADREALDAAIQELVDLGLQRESAAESIYKERCISVLDGPTWAKYMSVSGSSEDEFDIVNLQYTEDGLLSVDENRTGHAAAFGDDIAIENLATEFKREVYVVQAHGSDAMVDEDNCVFFLPHRPRVQICDSPIFLFMKGTGWCGSGADHYEPLIANPLPFVSQDKAAVVL